MMASGQRIFIKMQPSIVLTYFTLFASLAGPGYAEAFNRLTAIRALLGRKKTPTEQKNPHHGELLPPSAERILYLLPIQSKPNVGEGLWGWAVEEIQWN